MAILQSVVRFFYRLLVFVSMCQRYLYVAAFTLDVLCINRFGIHAF